MKHCMALHTFIVGKLKGGFVVHSILMRTNEYGTAGAGMIAWKCIIRRARLGHTGLMVEHIYPLCDLL